jgi:hypothetical protein
MATKTSVNAKAYHSTITRATWGAATAGVHGGAAPNNLTEMTTVKDASFKIDVETADVSVRGGGGFKAYLATLVDIEATLTIPYDPTDASFIALMGAQLQKIAIPIALLDGDKATVNTQGVWADWLVTAANKTEELSGAQMFEFTLKPIQSTVPPEWVQVTS